MIFRKMTGIPYDVPEMTGIPYDVPENDGYSL